MRSDKGKGPLSGALGELSTCPPYLSRWLAVYGATQRGRTGAGGLVQELCHVLDQQAPIMVIKPRGHNDPPGLTHLWQCQRVYKLLR